jgi:tRNA/tmRNA/rRNA uracil-C5-methylase (TrmA/RlmC/RlmD family)
VEHVRCPHRPPCPGCPRFGEPGLGLAARAPLADLSRAHGLPEPAVICGPTAGFRLRARLAVRGRLGSPKLGLFEEGTHRVAHIPNCSVHHPLINRVASVVRRALVDARVTCYSDRAHLGLVRHLQVVVERSSQTAQVVLVANCPTPEPLRACLDLIRERLGEDLHSLWFNANQQPTNIILGPRFEHWHGPASVVEHFGGAAIHYPPGAFGQSNLDIAQRIIEHLREQIPADAKVVEFYAGVGAIGLSVLAKASQIRMNEHNPHSLEGLQLGLAGLDSASRAKISIIPGEAGANSSRVADADVVIADPPRKGLDPELSTFLSEQPPARFFYVSCGLESFVRDVERLTSRGRLRLASLTAFNLLPFTEQVETVARFERADP